MPWDVVRDFRTHMREGLIRVGAVGQGVLLHILSTIENVAPSQGAKVGIFARRGAPWLRRRFLDGNYLVAWC